MILRTKGVAMSIFETKVTQDAYSSKWRDSFSGGIYDGSLPLWVADMDFRIAEPIIDAVTERAKQGVYGYTKPSDEYFDAILQWSRQQWQTSWEKEWILPVPGVVTATNIALQTIACKGEGVLLQTPIYHPFYASIQNNGLKLISNPLLQNARGFAIDFEDLDQKLSQSKVMILCNPHNPTGKVYSRDELEKIVQLANKHDVYLVLDEIHADLVYKPAVHHSILTISGVNSERTIVLNAPSKTFNIAGLSSSYFIIPDKNLYQKILQTQQTNGPKEVNLFGLTATEAAYHAGRAWHEESLAYLQENRDYAGQWIETNIPSVAVRQPEGTYFLWLDFRKTKIPADELFLFLLNTAKVRLSPGEQFGREGQGFARLNFACQRSTLEQALQRIQHALASL